MSVNIKKQQQINNKMIVYSVSNMIIGLGILTLPNRIVQSTIASDGWISILLGGMCAIVFAWLIGKLSDTFPGKSYHDIASHIMNRKTAHIVTLLFGLYFLLFVSYQVRGVANITRVYLFDNTPEEFIGFIYLLVLIYGIAGPSIALLRLNLLFFPIIMTVLVLLLLLNIGSFNVHHLLPVFKTPFSGILTAAKEMVFPFLGFEIMLFYNIFSTSASKVTKPVLFGVLLPLVLYLTIYIFVIGVFGEAVTKSTLYPIAEMAKEVEIPGGVFERFEFFFFVVWLMTLFSTSVMAFDVAILSLQSIFTKVSKLTLILISAPIMYIIGLLPSNLLALQTFSDWISYMGIGFAWAIPSLLLVIAKLKGVRGI